MDPWAVIDTTYLLPPSRHEGAATEGTRPSEATNTLMSQEVTMKAILNPHLIVRGFALAIALFALPLAVDSSSKGSFVRLDAVCAEPTECESSRRHICRLGDENYKRYKCSRGCDQKV